MLKAIALLRNGGYIDKYSFSVLKNCFSCLSAASFHEVEDLLRLNFFLLDMGLRIWLNSTIATYAKISKKCEDWTKTILLDNYCLF